MPGSKLHSLQAKYENYVSLTASRATANRYSKALDAFFDMFPERRFPQQFTRMDIEDFRIRRIRKGVSARTVNYETQIVRAFWNWMINMEEAEYNPASTVKRLKEVEPERNSLSVTDQDRLYETAASTGVLMDRILVGLALSTGLRAATLIQLQKEHVDFAEKALRVPATIMKAGRNHEIPLRDEELALLEGLPPGRIFNGYSNNAGNLSRRFTSLCKRSGVPLRGLRTARRTFATTLLRGGSDLRMVQDLLAHRNIQTTSRYLTPADKKETREAISRLPRPGLTPQTGS